MRKIWHKVTGQALDFLFIAFHLVNFLAWNLKCDFLQQQQVF